MEQYKISPKKVTFSDYDEIEIIDEWAIVSHTTAKKPRKSIVSKKLKHSGSKNSMLLERDSLKKRRICTKKTKSKDFSTTKYNKHCSISIKKLDPCTNKKLRSIKTNRAFTKKLVLKTLKNRNLKNTLLEKLVSDPAVKPATCTIESVRKSLPSARMVGRSPRIPPTKHINVDLTTPNKKGKFSAHESLNIYYKTGSVRSPVHAPKERACYSSLTIGNMRKHNLRQNRSISNESLVGGLMSGRTSCVSGHTLIQNSKQSNLNEKVVPNIGKIFCNTQRKDESVLSMSAQIKRMANLSMMSPSLSIFGGSILSGEGLVLPQARVSKAEPINNLQSQELSKVDHNGEEARSDIEENNSLAHCSTDEF
ncbi:unnamed protein product [Moneuplotes crassus]|uniref:Uncharacterized protein n=1 Tax=Euplotes crassus TaxID=5936 RepID=A0AAD1UJX3_EUPCR|nr:unnamed protein product [Moneuplotes crassus]